MENSLAVFLHSSRHDRIYQAASILATACSMDWSCHLFLFFEALGSFVEGKWDEVNILPVAKKGPASEEPGVALLGRVQRGFELSNFPSLYEMIHTCRQEDGKLKVYACSNSVRLLELEPGDVKGKVDEIIGLPTMLQITSGVRHVLYI